MTSWRDSASLQAQDDLDRLLNVVLPFAEQRVQAYGEFFPFGAIVTTDGEVAMIAVAEETGSEKPSSREVLDSLYAGVIRDSATARAAAFVADVDLDGGDAIRAQLEHAEGPSLTILMSYTRGRLRKSVTLRAVAGSSRTTSRLDGGVASGDSWQ